jgi:hypothetical protein
VDVLGEFHGEHLVFDQVGDRVNAYEILGDVCIAALIGPAFGGDEADGFEAAFAYEKNPMVGLSRMRTADGRVNVGVFEDRLFEVSDVLWADRCPLALLDLD